MNLKLFLLIVFLPVFILSQPIQLKGKVINSDKDPVKNLSIRFTSFGDAVTTGSGEFIITVPQDVRFVDVRVKDNMWQLLYPVDAKIPVPTDPNFITTIIVSETSPGTSSMNESVIKYNKLENILKDIGTTNTELNAFLEKFIDIESGRMEMSESKLRDEFEKKLKKETAFTEISRILNEYILRAKNLKTTFELFHETAFVSTPAVENLNKAIGAYNPVYESLHNNYNSWKTVIKLVRDSVLAENFVASVNYMIEEIHKPYIFKLNNSIKLINEIRLGIESSEQDIEEKKKAVKDIISSTTENLEMKIPTLENRFKELLNNLHNES